MWCLGSSVALLLACGTKPAAVSPPTQQSASALPSTHAAASASSAPPPASSASAAPPAVAAGLKTGSAGEFHCASEQRPVGLRVEERFVLRTIPIDINGQELGAMEMVDAKNVYTLKSLAHEGRRSNRVQVVLHSHALAPGATAFAEQDPWQKALTGGWLGLTRPFELERHAEAWCITGRKCPAPGSSEHRFLATLGAVVVLMMPLEKLQAQLDQKPSDGTLSLEYSDTAGELSGEKTPPKLQAHQLGSGLPAKFELTSERRNVSLQSAAAVKLPMRSAKATKLETSDRFTVDRECRLREIAQTIAAEYTLVPNTKSAIRFVQIHERTLTVE